MPLKTFKVEIRDYESGYTEDRLTANRIERVVQRMLDKDESDGVVVVTETDAQESGS